MRREGKRRVSVMATSDGTAVLHGNSDAASGVPVKAKDFWDQSLSLCAVREYDRALDCIEQAIATEAIERPHTTCAAEYPFLGATVCSRYTRDTGRAVSFAEQMAAKEGRVRQEYRRLITLATTCLQHSFAVDDPVQRLELATSAGEAAQNALNSATNDAERGESLHTLALAFACIGELPKALRAAEMSLQKYAARHDGCVLLALLHTANRHYQTARTVLETARVQHPHSVEVAALLAAVHDTMGVSAAEPLKAALQNARARGVAFASPGAHDATPPLDGDGVPRTAVMAAFDGKATADHTIMGYLCVGTVALHVGREGYDVAKVAVDAAVEVAGSQAVNNVLLSLLRTLQAELARPKDVQLSRTHLHEALALHRGNSKAMCLLADLEDERSPLRQTLYESAIKHDPTNARAHGALGALYAASGDAEDAMDLLLRAAALSGAAPVLPLPVFISISL